MDFTKTKNSTLFLKYVIPQMIGLVFNSIYFIVDGVFIGRRLGTNSLAAAGVAVPMVEGMIALSMLIAVGTGILVSASAGQGNRGGARGTFNTAMGFTLALSTAVALLGVAFTTPLARFLGAEPAILAETTTYLRYFMGFSPFLVFSFVLSTCLRNDGKPTLAMWALTVGSLSNIVLDYIFMYPLNMGIGGAALATGLGPVFSVIIMLPHFLRKKGMLYFQKPRFNLGTLGRIGVNGLPAFVAEFSIGFVTLLYNKAIVANGLGEDGLAAYVVVGYAALISLTAFLGAAQGVQPVVSFFAGAGKPGRIRALLRTTVAFCLGLAALLYATLFFAGSAFFGIFIHSNAALLAFTAGVARLYFICLPFAALNILLVSFMQAMGKIKPAMAVSLSRSTLPVLLFLMVLPLVWPQNGLWLAATMAEVVTLFVAVTLWVRIARGMPAETGAHTPAKKTAVSLPGKRRPRKT